VARKTIKRSRKSTVPAERGATRGGNRAANDVAIEPELADPEEASGALPLDDESTELDADREHPEIEPDGASLDDHDEAGPGEGLVRYDPLGSYLAEVRRFPILSREEEQKVAQEYARTQDPQYAYQLVTSNLRLVVKIAGEFARAQRNLLDLIQEGNLGLMEAVKHFEPSRRIRFPSYAVWWVRAYIYRYLINNWRLVKIGTTQAQRKLFFNLRKETARLEAEGFAPQPRLLAQRIGVKESEVLEMQERMGQSEVSLDQPAGTGDDSRLLDVIPDPSRSPEEIASGAQWRSFAREKVEAFENTLKDKELEIFRSRLMAEEPATLQEIGERFGISRERVRQIEGRIKRRLKAFLKSQASDIEQAGP
jgi:RNA polymerase sigma-32 factor